ncbi:hypothetical protein ADUPG1_004947, partial [Aduncisulcus paluster]
MENLNDFFLRYDAYKSNPKVSNPSPWHRLIDPALLSSLKDILGFDSISTSEELKSLKRPFILWMGQRLRLTFIWHSYINYVKAFKAVIQQAPDFGVDKTIVGIFLRNAFPTAM